MWTKMMRALALGSLLLFGAAWTAPAQAADEAGAFVQGLGDHAIAILQSTAGSPAERKAAFSKLFTDGFDVPTIGKFVLGRYWKAATPEQQSEYVKLFGIYVVSVYSDRFSNYSGEKFHVIGSRTEDDATVVNSEILRPNGGPPIHIDWKVYKSPTGWKITDVVVENLSMTVTQRAEFSSIIERGGGNIQALIDLLKQKTNAG